MIAGFIINLLALAIPLFIMLVYDRIIALGTLDPLPILTLGAFAAVALEYKLRNVRSRGLSWLSGRLDHIVSNKIFSHLIGLPPALIERASVAAQVARIKTFESVRDFFSGSACLSVLEAPFVVIAIAAIGFVAGPLIWVPVIVIGLYLLIFAFVRQQVKTAIRLAAKCSSARQQFTIESFEKLHDIRACGLTQHWQEKFRHLSGREIMSHFKLGWLGMMAETSANSLTVLSAVATIGFGVHMIWAGTLSTGGLVAVMILVWRILTPFYSLCTMIPRLEQLRNSIIQVNNLMDIDAEEETAKSHARLIQITGRLRFADVTFRYDADADPVLERLSFQLGAGEMLGLSGENGSGKSSVLKLIKSLYKPEGGAIFIDGFDVRQLDAPHLRRQIAYVPKNPKSFRGTILENMRLSNPTASAKDIEKALRLADVWDDVQKLPNGLETVIGKHNRLNLSSGMETRLALARAYLHPGKILMIDSLPNALLSGPAGHNLKTYLSRIRGIRTVIMVSYRDDFLKMADQVLILRSHSQAVSGSYDQVTQQLNSKQQSVAV